MTSRECQLLLSCSANQTTQLQVLRAILRRSTSVLKLSKIVGGTVLECRWLIDGTRLVLALAVELGS
jgi:hypothetical protein